MTPFDPEKAWKPYVSLLPTAQMAAAIQNAAKFAGEPLIDIIPSIQLLPDGPKLDSLYLITANGLRRCCERFPRGASPPVIINCSSRCGRVAAHQERRGAPPCAAS